MYSMHTANSNPTEFECVSRTLRETDVNQTV